MSSPRVDTFAGDRAGGERGVGDVLRQLPRYRSHKEVWALKIKAIIPNPRGVELHFEDDRFVPMEMPAEWAEKHDPKAPGYFVWYADGYKSWSPVDAFENGCTLVEGADGSVRAEFMDFGDAICALKHGKRVARAGWNGKGMWLALVHGRNWGIGGRAPYDVPGGAHVEHASFIGMKTADDNFVPWLASQTDMLATDWQVVE